MKNSNKFYLREISQIQYIGLFWVSLKIKNKKNKRKSEANEVWSQLNQAFTAA